MIQTMAQIKYLPCVRRTVSLRNFLDKLSRYCVTFTGTNNHFVNLCYTVLRKLDKAILKQTRVGYSTPIHKGCDANCSQLVRVNNVYIQPWLTSRSTVLQSSVHCKLYLSSSRWRVDVVSYSIYRRRTDILTFALIHLRENGPQGPLLVG